MQPVGLFLDIYYMGVVDEVVFKSRSQYIIAEQLAPIAEIFVAGEDHTAVPITLGDQLEEQLRLLAVELRIATSLIIRRSGRK